MAGLVPTKDATIPSSPVHPPMSKGKDLIRLYKLQSLAIFKSWRLPIEQKKVALRQSHLVAAGHALLHLVPLCGAIALLMLNWSHYFVGPFFTLSTTLQFVAKLHELLMQTSMAEIVLCIIRTQALEGYVPLGALSATTQSMHISYIWSIDFLAAVTSQSFPGPRRYLFVVLVPVLIALTALVGPSSANLMIPRPGTSSQRSLLSWGSKDDVNIMFPSQLDAKQNLTFNFESFEATYNLEVLAPHTIAHAYSITEASSITQTYSITQAYSNKKDLPGISALPRALQLIKIMDQFGDPHASAAATIPTQMSAGVLGSVSTDPASNQTISVELPRPVVTVKCMSSTLKADSQIEYFLDSGNSTGMSSSFKDLIQQHLSRFNSTDASIDSLPPLWSRSPEPGSSSYIANVFNDSCASSPGSKSYHISNVLDDHIQTTNTCLSTLTCTVAAYWELSEHEVIMSDGLRLVRTAPLSAAVFEIPRKTRAMTVDWDNISSLNSSRFAKMLYPSDGNVGSSLILAISLATIISETSGQSKRTTINLPKEAKQQNQYKIARVSHGYGYETSSISTRLSLAIIMTYCIVTVAYITYMLASGHTSTAWNSATELIVLALQSRRTEHLGHTSVGIGSIKTYREAVGIRVGDGKSLELVFAKDSNAKVKNLRRVVPNMAY